MKAADIGSKLINVMDNAPSSTSTISNLKENVERLLDKFLQLNNQKHELSSAEDLDKLQAAAHKLTKELGATVIAIKRQEYLDSPANKEIEKDARTPKK